jgi:hypothetical protein
MNTVTDIVRAVLEKSPTAYEALQNGWLNLSQYAVFIQPKVAEISYKRVQTGSIITALSRIRNELRDKQEPKIMINNISLKTPISELNFAKESDHAEKIKKAYEKFATQENSFLNIISGNTETGIFVNSKYEQQVIAAFSPLVPNLHLTDLAAISIKLNPEYLLALGGVYEVLKYLVWEKINLLEVISTYTELTLIVDKKAANRVVEILTQNF